jgi:hypothetical protein
VLASDAAVIVWPDAAELKEDSPEDYEISLSILRDIAESLADPAATSGRPKAVCIYVGGG